MKKDFVLIASDSVKGESTLRIRGSLDTDTVGRRELNRAMSLVMLRKGAGGIKIRGVPVTQFMESMNVPMTPDALNGVLSIEASGMYAVLNASPMDLNNLVTEAKLALEINGDTAKLVCSVTLANGNQLSSEVF